MPGENPDHAISDSRRSIGFSGKMTYQPRYPSTHKPAHARKWLPKGVGYQDRRHLEDIPELLRYCQFLALSGPSQAPSAKTTQDMRQVGVSFKGGALSTLSLKKQRSLISRGRKTNGIDSRNDKSPKIFAASLAPGPKAKVQTSANRPLSDSACFLR